MLRTKRGDSPREGSSSIRILGLDINPRPMASICCSPPDKGPGALAFPFLQPGKRPKIFFRLSILNLWALGIQGPQFQVFQNGHGRKKLTSFGDLDDPQFSTISAVLEIS